MGKSRPLCMLLLLCLANLLFTGGICIAMSVQHLISAGSLIVLVLCSLCLLSTSLFCALISNNILRSYVEPIESSVSKALAATGTNLKNTGEVDYDLEAAVDQLVNAFNASRQRERLIAEYSSDILCCLDERHRILSLNKQAESVFGYQLISLLSKNVDSLVFDGDKQAFIAYLDACRNAPPVKTCECRVRNSSGKLIDLEWQVEWSESLKCFFSLSRDITDRKEKQRLKTEIMAMVGHDLRAPMVTVSYVLEHLMNGDLGRLPEATDEPIARARGSVNHMLTLINRLLDAEHLESGELKLDLRIIPLSEVYEQCKQLLHDLAGEKRQTLLWPETERLAMANFDRSCQILCNLVSNAIKWSGEGSTIRTTETSDSHFITIRVADQGPGIAEERRQTIFERFKSSELKNDILKSSGLGLYIAKKLALLQGGSIGLESSAEKGSTFWFSLKEISLAEAESMLHDDST